MYRSFREIIELLDSQGKLVRLTKRVNPQFEMPALMKTLEDESKAFIFENVKGSKYPAVSNLYGTLERSNFIFRDSINKVKKLIKEGKLKEAKKFTVAHSKAWIQKASEGKLLNLSDYIGMNEITTAAILTEKPKNGKQ